MKNINGQDIYGTDVCTLINKAIDINEKNDIDKDEDGFYIENNLNSCIIVITFIIEDDKGEFIEKTVRMESLQSAGLDGFISNFGVTLFRCTDIKYNDNGFVNKIYIKQIEV